MSSRIFGYARVSSKDQNEERQLKAFKDYYKHLKDEASSQQEVQMLEDVAREISEM